MNSFYKRPILNSPYRVPALRHPLDENGQPLEGEPLAGRRASRVTVPVPGILEKRPVNRRWSLKHNDNAVIKEIADLSMAGRHCASRPTGVRPACPQRLLEHWRHHEFNGPTPCSASLSAASVGPTSQ